MVTHTDTVAAVSTPYGKGGIATIRISGADAVTVAGRCFFPASGKALADCPARAAVFGAIFSEGEQIDTGVAVCFRAPHSFTGEDTVELSCHGGILLTKTVLESVLRAGALPAPAGEFTKRAFLHGKLDLSQAEAVIELIDAKNPEALKLASARTRGVFSDKTARFREELTALVSSTYAAVDFPDEDLSPVSAAEMRERLSALSTALSALLGTYRAGHAIAEGIPTVLIGKPNVGKSSLLNALSREDRAIVTAQAGTTRDTIEESVPVGKITLRLCDTAGLREASGTEALGVERALAKLRQAELILAVFDGSRALDAEDAAVCARLRDAAEAGQAILALRSKNDLPAAWDASALAALLPAGVTILSCAAKDGGAAGIAPVADAISALYEAEKLDYGEAIVANARQKLALERTRDAVLRARSALDAGFPQDVAGLDLEDALAALSELDGRAVSESVVSAIFSRFCVGK